MNQLDLDTWGLKLRGEENQSFRFLIRRFQRSFVAIPGYGVPLLQCLMPLVARHQSCLDAMLALATRLRSSGRLSKKNDRYMMAVPQRSAQHSSNEALDRYQEIVSGLRSTIAHLQPVNDDIEEAVAVSMILCLFGFPSHDIWTVHLNGLVALLETQSPISDPFSLYATAARMAAHADITCFSLGRKENSQRLWLRWDICPVEDEILTSSKLDFRSSEVSTGYPESLLTIIALLSAAVEDDLKDRPLDYISYTYLQTLSKEWKAGNCTENRVASIYIDPSETAGERSFVAWKPAIEFAIARWQPPSIPESLSVDTSLVLNTAWELIRKAALIYLWRGSFEADVLAHLPANHFALIDRFIREMCVGFEQVIQAAERHHINTANALIWPLTVVANECARYPHLQPRILSFFQRICSYFTIPHHQTLEVLIRELWKQAEGRTPQSAPDGRVKLSLLSLAAESNTCLPLL